MQLRGGEITGLAGVSGNGQAALAALIAGTLKPQRRHPSSAAKGLQMVGARGAQHRIGRIPEDRHATGMIGDMSVTENVISEAYRSAALQPSGISRLEGGGQFRRDDHPAYDVKCPSPNARVRLLSGGNMQKLILGRASTAIRTGHSRQPADARARCRRGRLCACTAARGARSRRGDPADLRGSRRGPGAVRPDRRDLKRTPVAPSQRGELSVMRDSAN
jgi:hypothetical protein